MIPAGFERWNWGSFVKKVANKNLVLQNKRFLFGSQGRRGGKQGRADPFGEVYAEHNPGIGMQ
jgi:hypothetical protein